MSITPPAVWRSRVDKYRLVGKLCTQCGRAHYPPLKTCPYCGSRSLNDVELGRRGRLLSYTAVYATPPDKRDKTPLVVGLVDLGLVRVVAEITDVDPGEVREGMEVEAVFRKIKEDGSTGLIVYSVKFRPAISASDTGDRVRDDSV